MKITNTLDCMEVAHMSRYAGREKAQLVPFIGLFDAQGGIHTILNLELADDRQPTIDAIKKALLLTGSHGYIFSSEAWMIEGEKNGDPVVMPRDSDRRIEVLIMEGHSSAETATRIYEIERDWDTGETTGLRLITSILNDPSRVSRFDVFAR